jgi:hypothetical protein
MRTTTLRPTAISVSVLLLAISVQTPLRADTPAGPADARPYTMLPRQLRHDWDLLRGRPDPLQRALAAARRDLKIARDERSIANRGGRDQEYLQRAHARLQDIRRSLQQHWNDPMFLERLGYLIRAVRGMAEGTLVQTPRLYDRLDWELGRLMDRRWGP